MKVIVVTGTPGTGKTTLSSRLSAHFGYELVDIGDFSRKNSLIEGFDKARNCDIVDEKLLNSTMIAYLKKCQKSAKKQGFVIDSHMSHCLDPDIVDLCIITRVSLSDLRSRLVSRGYSESKVRENLDAEIMDICLIEALEAGFEPIEIDCSVIFDDFDIISNRLDL